MRLQFFRGTKAKCAEDPGGNQTETPCTSNACPEARAPSKVSPFSVTMFSSLFSNSFFLFLKLMVNCSTLLTEISTKPCLFLMQQGVLAQKAQVFQFSKVFLVLPLVNVTELEASRLLLKCASFPPPFHFVDFLPIIQLKNKFLWTGNILSEGYPALRYLKYYAFFLICLREGQLSARAAFRQMERAPWHAVRPLPTTPGGRTPPGFPLHHTRCHSLCYSPKGREATPAPSASSPTPPDKVL